MPPVKMSAVGSIPGGSEWGLFDIACPAQVFSVDLHSDLPHDKRRSAKRRRLLESGAKEYPVGLIADDGWGAGSAAPQSDHIGPIDPDAFTLNQFLNSLTICATEVVLVDDGEIWGDQNVHGNCGRAEIWSRSLPTAAPNVPAGPKMPAPDAGGATKNVPLDLGPDAIRHRSCPG